MILLRSHLASAIVAACACVSPALADTTLLVGTAGTANSTLTSGIRSFAVTNSGTTWTQSAFNSDGWNQTITAGVNGLAQDIYGNVYAAVNTGNNATVGIRIYRQTGGASVGYLNSTWGFGNLTGNSPDGTTLGPNGQLYATIAFGTGNNKLLSFNTTTLASGEIQTSQGGTNTNLTGLNTPRGITVASDGNFYLGNRGTAQILRWTGSGTTATVLATNTVGVGYQAATWDAGGNRLLTRSFHGQVGALTLTGVGSDNSIRTGAIGSGGLGVAAVEGQVAFTTFVIPNGTLATATGNPATQTNQATLVGPNYMLVLRDTRLWEGGTGSWNTSGNWQQGIGGATGAATFTSGTGATTLPSVLTFTGTGGTATNDVAGTVNVGGLNFAPGAGSYTLAGTPFTLGLNANIRNLSTTSQAISADIAVAGSQWIYGETNSLLTISGGISGAGTKLTKLGAGGLVLSAANTFDGGIDVTAGRLLVDGSLASGVSLASGALLGGSGSLPSLSVATGGLLAFDPASAGLTLPSGNNVTLTSPASFGVASLRTLSGEAINWGSVAPNTYSLLAGTTTSFSGIGNFGENNALVDGDRSMYFESSGTGLQLVVVPEPAGLALAGLGLAAAAWACRKKMGPKDAALRRSR
jgi:fibronectin-binding autotransporter adhesin